MCVRRDLPTSMKFLIHDTFFFEFGMLVARMHIISIIIFQLSCPENLNPNLTMYGSMHGKKPESSRSITNDSEDDDIEIKHSKYVQLQWHDDYIAANKTTDQALHLEPRYTTASSVLRRFLVPILAVFGPSLGLIGNDQLRKRAMILLTLIAAICTITVEWFDSERARQLKNKKSEEVVLEKIFNEISSPGSEEENSSDLETEAAISRLLSRPSVHCSPTNLVSLA